jgi:hypothetical protein
LEGDSEIIVVPGLGKESEGLREEAEEGEEGRGLVFVCGVSYTDRQALPKETQHYPLF